MDFTPSYDLYSASKLLSFFRVQFLLPKQLRQTVMMMMLTQSLDLCIEFQGLKFQGLMFDATGLQYYNFVCCNMAATIQPFGNQAIERHSMLQGEATYPGSTMPRTAHQVQCSNTERQEGDNCWQEESSWKVGYNFVVNTCNSIKHFQNLRSPPFLLLALYTRVLQQNCS